MDARPLASVTTWGNQPAVSRMDFLVGLLWLLSAPEFEIRLLQEGRIAVSLELIRIKGGQIQAGQGIEEIKDPRPQFPLNRINRPIDDGDRQFRVRSRGAVGILDLEVDLERLQRFGLVPFRQDGDIQPFGPGNDAKPERLLAVFAAAHGDRNGMIKAGPVLGLGFDLKPATPPLESGRPGVIDLAPGNRFPDRPGFRLPPVGGKQRQDFGLFSGAQDGARRIEFELLIVEHGFPLGATHNHECRLRGGRMLHGFAVEGFERRHGGQPPAARQLRQRKPAHPLIVGGERQFHELFRGFAPRFESDVEHPAAPGGRFPVGVVERTQTA